MDIYNKKYLAELIGTFIFCTGINMSTLYTSDSQLPNLFSIIASLFCAITITRNISGGHLNGAVTLAFTIDSMNQIKDNNNPKNITNNSNPVTLGIFYIIYQVAGAMLACLISFAFYNGHVLTFSNEKYNTIGIVVGEGISTFIFVFNILTQSQNRYSTNSSISTLLIVLGLFTAVNLTGTLSSGCINPSLAGAHFLTRMLFGKSDVYELYQTLLYIGGELGGAMVAGLLYNKYFRVEVDKPVNSEVEEPLNES